MIWTIFFFISVAAAVICAVMIIMPIGKNGRRINALRALFALCFVMTVALTLPANLSENGTDAVGVFKSIVTSLQRGIRVFGADGMSSTIFAEISSAPQWLAGAYLMLTLVVQLVAPLLAVSFLLSFFKNVSAYARYALAFGRDAYVFSDINERSLTLARDILDKSPTARVVFAGVFSDEQTDKANALGAICFKKDITDIRFGFHSKRKQICFFTIGNDEIENVNDSLKLIDKYNSKDNARLYIFSKGMESELLLAGKTEGRMKVRRIDEVHSMVTRILYENGIRVFESAAPTEGGKQISAIVVGTGERGTEMIKALSWYGQMDGYKLSITALDKDKLAHEKFAAQCPELLGDEYDIEICPGIDVDTKSFADKIAQIESATYVFVSLGSDERNVSVAVTLRMMFERMGIKPIIQAVVNNTQARAMLACARKSKKQSYDIDFVGDVRTLYSWDVIIASELERGAFERHKSYCNGDKEAEHDFWRYEYCYRSSMAAEVHARVCDKLFTDLTADERGALEHRRWKAYMRADGYIYSGSPDRASRNDLGKMHNNLTDVLTADDKAKDARISATIE